MKNNNKKIINFKRIEIEESKQQISQLNRIEIYRNVGVLFTPKIHLSPLKNTKGCTALEKCILFVVLFFRLIYCVIFLVFYKMVLGNLVLWTKGGNNLLAYSLDTVGISKSEVGDLNIQQKFHRNYQLFFIVSI